MRICWLTWHRRRIPTTGTPGWTSPRYSGACDMSSFGSLYTIGLPIKLYTLDDLEPHKPVRYVEPKEITEEMNDRFFCDIPKGTQIEWKHGVIVGKPGCGKTELFRFRAKYAYDKYGP